MRRCGGAAVVWGGVRPLNSSRHRIRANRSALRTTWMSNGFNTNYKIHIGGTSPRPAPDFGCVPRTEID